MTSEIRNIEIRMTLKKLSDVKVQVAFVIRGLDIRGLTIRGLLNGQKRQITRKI